MDDAVDLLARRHELIYCLKLGVSYHRKRERFFDMCDKGTKTLTVILGGSLLATYIKDIAPIIGAAVSAVGLLALVYGYTDKKQKHKELADAFSELYAKVEAAGRAPASSALDGWLSELHKLNAKEPPCLGTLVVLCQNEIAIAEGKPESVVPVNGFKKFFANFSDFHVAT